MRYVDNNFTNNFYNTIGVDFVLICLIIIENQVDIPGEQECEAANRNIEFNIIVGHSWSG